MGGASALGSLLGAGAGLGLNFGLNAYQAKLSDDAAQKQRAFARKMAETAYQRTTRDMRAAGINPLLAYKAGPTPVMGVGQAAIPNFGGGSGAAAAGAASALGAIGEERAEKTREKTRGGIDANTALTAVQQRVAEAQEKRVQQDIEINQPEVERARLLTDFDKSELGQDILSTNAFMQRIGLGNVSGLVGVAKNSAREAVRMFNRTRPLLRGMGEAIKDATKATPWSIGGQGGAKLQKLSPSGKALLEKSRKTPAGVGRLPKLKGKGRK